MFRIFVPLKAGGSRKTNQYKLKERQQSILDMIRKNPAIQTEEIEKELKISRSTAQREIQEIKKAVSLVYNKRLEAGFSRNETRLHSKLQKMMLAMKLAMKFDLMPA